MRDLAILTLDLPCLHHDDDDNNDVGFDNDSNESGGCGAEGVSSAFMAMVVTLTNAHEKDVQKGNFRLASPSNGNQHSKSHPALLLDGKEWLDIPFELQPNQVMELRHDFTLSAVSDATNHVGSKYDENQNASPKLQLWWPRNSDNHLHPTLYRLYSQIILVTNDSQLSHDATVAFGIRTIQTHIEQHLASNTQGRSLKINGQKLFLLGGNWITSDAFFLKSNSHDRYCTELSLHVDAGLNALRVWGGGIIETDAFYECADALGILVYQEFGLTGDNNGRWGGSYEWLAEQQEEFLVYAEDAIRRLRSHPSLFLYGGGNELYPETVSPPSYVVTQIRTLLQTLDVDNRDFIPSSMDGGLMGGKQALHDDNYALAPKDGPYGIQFPATYFARNAGLGNGDGEENEELKVVFQPEVGTMSAPSYIGLRRFLTEQEVEDGYPQQSDPNSVGEAWEYHKFQTWSIPTNTSCATMAHHDFVYAYGTQVNATQWAETAQIVSHVQHQSLVEGYITRLFDWYTALFLWKTQSPLPTLRSGFLYDYWLERSGAYRGVVAATGGGNSCENKINGDGGENALWSVHLDLQTMEVVVVNRKIISHILPDASVSITWFDLAGSSVVAEITTPLGKDAIPPSSTRRIFYSTSSDDNRNSRDANSSGYPLIIWPKQCHNNICFLRLQLVVNSQTVFTNWRWFTADPTRVSTIQAESLDMNTIITLDDYTILQDVRTHRRALATLNIINVTTVDLHPSVRAHRLNVDHTVAKSLKIEFTLHISALSPELLFYPTLRVDPSVPTTTDSQTQGISTLHLPPWEQDAVPYSFHAPRHGTIRSTLPPILLPGTTVPLVLWIPKGGRGVQISISSWNGPSLSQHVELPSSARTTF